MRISALVLLLLAVVPGETPPPVVSVSAPKNVAVAGGESVDARISVSVRDGYHVQANPASEDYLIPTRLEFKSGPDITIRRLTYPPGRPYRLKGTDKDLQTYEGTFDVLVSLTVSASARPGKRILDGQLRFQACDSTTCYFPASVSVTFAVDVLTARSKASWLRPSKLGVF